MPRRARSIVGGIASHVLNRAVGRQMLFEEPSDNEAFERVLEEARQREPMRILGYCIMPNHWHLVLWTESELEAISRRIQRGCPLGGDRWRMRTVGKLGLESSLHPRGRPRKETVR